MQNSSTAMNDFRSLNFNDLVLPSANFNLQNLPSIRYRGEGNLNLVLELSQTKFVMRFEKSSKMSSPSVKVEESKISFVYHYLFIDRLLSDQFNSVVPVLAEIPHECVAKFEELVSNCRPEHRKAKSVSSNIVEIYPDCAFLPEYRKYVLSKGDVDLIEAPGTASLREILSADYLNYRNFVFSFLTDLAFRNRYVSDLSNGDRERSTWCVEIKPKQGWVAVPDRLPGKCMFCMIQYLKLTNGKAKSRSRYCPLDLFSGNLDRMRRSIEGLLETPQNNLRIFKNGTLVYGEAISDVNILSDLFNDEDTQRCKNKFSSLIVGILTHENADRENKLNLRCEAVATDVQSSEFPSDFIDSVHISQPRCTYQSTLSGSSILSRIYDMQKLDQVGVEAVAEFHKSHTCEYQSGFDFIHNLVSRIELKNAETVTLNVLEAYLFATAAWDLSILIAMRVSTERERQCGLRINDASGTTYDVNVTVVDVGPKSIRCVAKHRNRNRDALNAFINYYRSSTQHSESK